MLCIWALWAICGTVLFLPVRAPCGAELLTALLRPYVECQTLPGLSQCPAPLPTILRFLPSKKYYFSRTALNNVIYFLTILWLSVRLSCLWFGCLQPSLACSQLPSHCVLSWLFLCMLHGSGVSLLQGHYLWGLGPHPRTLSLVVHSEVLGIGICREDKDLAL